MIREGAQLMRISFRTLLIAAGAIGAGVVASVGATPAAVAEPAAAASGACNANGVWNVCGYDPVYAFKKVNIDFCGKSATRAELDAFGKLRRNDKAWKAALSAKLDQCLTALVWDLERLDMLDDVTVIAWGEFGRTPRINKEAGRDHWPQVSCAVLAGGGIKTGQIVGSTNRLGEYAKDRPVTFGDMFATLYHSLGLTPETAVIDPTGRPQHVAEGERIRELI